MPPLSPDFSPYSARSRWPWVVLILGLAVLAVVVVLGTVERITHAPAAALEQGTGLIKEAGKQAATVAGAFRQRNVREEFLSSSTSLSGTKRLQVATLQEHETFRRREQDSAVWGLISLPAIVVQADVPVEYTYYLDFDGTWDFVRKDDEVTVHAPPILANAPAPDISKFTLYTVEGHVWQDDKGVRGRLQGSLSAALRNRAAEHVPLIREMARRQLATFVEKWMATSFSDGKEFHVKVLFADEKEGAKEGTLPPAEKSGG